MREEASGGRVSKPAREGDVEGRRERGGGGCFCCCCCICDCFSCQSAAACLASRRDYRTREQLRGEQRKRLVRAIFYSALLWEPQTHCGEVDLGTGNRSAHPWITSSKGDCYYRSTNPLVIFSQGVNPSLPHQGVWLETERLRGTANQT